LFNFGESEAERCAFDELGVPMHSDDCLRQSAEEHERSIGRVPESGGWQGHGQDDGSGPPMIARILDEERDDLDARIRRIVREELRRVARLK
jgi:hypothetical protein